jgi:hypothetical protein
LLEIKWVLKTSLYGISTYHSLRDLLFETVLRNLAVLVFLIAYERGHSKVDDFTE